MITQLINIYGKVQGVGFRYSTERLASHYKVTGTVQNVDDFVQVIVTGEKDEVRAFTDKVIIGPAPFSRVERYEIQQLPIQSYSQFKQI